MLSSKPKMKDFMVAWLKWMLLLGSMGIITFTVGGSVASLIEAVTISVTETQIMRLIVGLAALIIGFGSMTLILRKKRIQSRLSFWVMLEIVMILVYIGLRLLLNAVLVS